MPPKIQGQNRVASLWGRVVPVASPSRRATVRNVFATKPRRRVEMNYIGGFELDVSLGHEGSPASVRVVLRNVAQGPEGQVFITPECTSLDDVESYINAIQTDLDDMRNQ